MKKTQSAVLVLAFAGAFVLRVAFAAAQTPPATRPATRSAEDTLSQMLRPSAQAAQPLRPIEGANGMLDITSGPNAIPPGASTRPVLQEGTFIVDRAGRLTIGGSGQQMEFTFDADGRRMTDPPVILLPNLNLMKMEAAVTGNRRDLKFRITGEVTEYKGRNYILLQKVVQVSDALQPLR